MRECVFYLPPFLSVVEGIVGIGEGAPVRL